MEIPLENQFREAVASGEFHRAQQLWNAYTAQFQEEVKQGRLSEARLQQVRELIEWSRSIALCARTHVQARLNHRLRISEYSATPAPQSPQLLHLQV